MSRAQPFPTNPSRRFNNSPTPYDDLGAPSETLPLSISRGPRPSTPTSSQGSIRAGHPARPLRSELRPRQLSQYSQSSLNRESTGTTFSDSPGPSAGRTRQYDDAEEDATSPKAMVNVLSAFQQAGRRRAMTNGSSDQDRVRDREREAEQEKERQRRIRNRAPGRRANGVKKATGDIDAILEQIKDEWDFVIDPDFNPVDLALQLLDESSLGKDRDSFLRTKSMLSGALKGSVDKHYQAFAAALPHHAGLVSHLTTAQGQVTDARSALLEAKDALGNKRADLVQLWSRSQVIEEMLKILDQIEQLKTVPDTLETLMSEKRLLQASVLLMRSLKTINKQDMQDVGAVGDLRSYLLSQETALRDVLIDELHGHLYLKSFWCESRWSNHTPGQQSLQNPNDQEEALGMVSSDKPTTRLAKYLRDLDVRPNDAPLDLNDAELPTSSSNSALARSSIASFTKANLNGKEAGPEKNPESDSFGYIETLLESLSVLGKLGMALDSVAQRLPTEIYTLVEATIEDVESRADDGRRFSTYGAAVGGRPSSVYVFAGEGGLGISPSQFLPASSLRLAALESSEKRADHEVLRDLFWTLYSKLEAVTEGLRVIYEVANRIGSRRDFKDASGARPGSLFPLTEMWLPVQSEVRTLLDDYLNDQEKGASTGRNPIASINEVLREGRFARDRARQMFRFADTDVKSSSKALRQHEEELTRVLRDTVPGLVHSALEAAGQTTLAQVGADDRLIGAEHHRLLIHPDAFHVSVLLQPTLAFLQKVSDALPTGMDSAQASIGLLDDFVKDVYLPLLEEKTFALFHQAVTGAEAFQPDPASSTLSQQPLIKASTQLVALINSLCSMLRTSPFRRENYSRLILGVIIQFYQRCSDYFYKAVSRGRMESAEAPLVLSAKWSQNGELNEILGKLMHSEDLPEAELRSLCMKESRTERALLGDQQLERVDLLAIRDVTSLGHLYRSLVWFIEHLNSLKTAPSEDVLSPTTPFSPLLPVLTPVVPNEQLQLPLSREMAMRFDALRRTYEQLAELILCTIRIDVRCRAMLDIGLAMRHANYNIDQEASEPDPHIVDLNAELGRCDESTSLTLPEKDRRFIFEGLEDLMEDLLITNARYIRTANAFGIKKMMRNIQALRQNLKTMSTTGTDAEFERARYYFSLYSLGPQAMLDKIKEDRHFSFSFDEYKTLLNLQCGVDQGLPEGSSQPTDVNYNMYVIELHGLDLEDTSLEA